MVEGGRDRKGEGTEARGPPLLPNQENTLITQHWYESSSWNSVIPRSALAHFQKVLTSCGSHVKRMKINLENDPSDSSPTNCQHANTASAFLVITYSSPACSAWKLTICWVAVPDIQFLPRAGKYANIPAPSGALFKFTFLKKTLSPRYFRQRKILGERLSVAWSVKTV